MKKTAIILFVILNLLALRTSYAQTSAVTNGLNYLYSVQNADGSWGSAASQKEILPATVSVIETFEALSVTDKTSYSNAVTWLQGQSVTTTEYLSERMLNLTTAAADQETLLTYIDSLSYAWGGYDDYGVSIIDTALALQALTAANYSDTTVIDQALSFLLTSQNTDGGWGLISGDESSTYVTAIVASTLQNFTQTTTLATASSKAMSFLLSHQNTDGGFASSPSTVYETALVYKALAPLTTDNTVLGNAVNYLTANQAANGSWNDDPYSTALALQALHLSENKPTPLPSPTSGTVSGTVVDGATNQPLNGVAIQLSGDGGQFASTSNGGAFSVTNVPAGSYQISLSVNGYSSYSETVTVSAGSIINLGTILLSASPTFGMIQGTITDASTGLPLSGVVITITGSSSWSATTASDGSFKLTDITPGSVTLSASMTGYYAVSGTGAVTAGGTLTFSPSLSTSPPVATTGGIKGTVTDSATGLPIQGALVTITPDPAGTGPLATDVLGMFALASMEPGTYTVTINAANYTGQTYLVTILGGVITDLGSIRLNPSPTSATLTVFGVVWDAETNNPIAGAEVSVRGTDQTALTDSGGRYTLSGLTEIMMGLKASAVGYNSNFNSLVTDAFGEYEVSFALDKSRMSAVDIKLLSTDKPEYPANTPVNILSELENTGDATAEITVSVQIADQYGNILSVVTYPGNPALLEPHVAQTITLQWDPEQNPPGPYQLTLSLYDNAEGGLIAESATSLTISPTAKADSLVSVVSPRFINVKATETINISAYLVNRSNVDASFTAQYEIKDPAGIVLKDGAIDFSLSTSEAFKVIVLADFTNTFTQSGQYPVSLKIFSGSELLAQATDAVYVAPKIRIEPTNSMEPSTVIPDGDKELRINIQIKGVEDLP